MNEVSKELVISIDLAVRLVIDVTLISAHVQSPCWREMEVERLGQELTSKLLGAGMTISILYTCTCALSLSRAHTHTIGCKL